MYPKLGQLLERGKKNKKQKRQQQETETKVKVKMFAKMFPFLSCREAPYVGKAKTKFRARFNNYKSAHRSYRKKT